MGAGNKIIEAGIDRLPGLGKSGLAVIAIFTFACEHFLPKPAEHE